MENKKKENQMTDHSKKMMNLIRITMTQKMRVRVRMKLKKMKTLK